MQSRIPECTWFGYYRMSTTEREARKLLCVLLFLMWLCPCPSLWRIMGRAGMWQETHHGRGRCSLPSLHLPSPSSLSGATGLTSSFLLPCRDEVPSETGQRGNLSSRHPCLLPPLTTLGHWIDSAESISGSCTSDSRVFCWIIEAFFDNQGIYAFNKEFSKKIVLCA